MSLSWDVVFARVSGMAPCSIADDVTSQPSSPQMHPTGVIWADRFDTLIGAPWRKLHWHWSVPLLQFSLQFSSHPRVISHSSVYSDSSALTCHHLLYDDPPSTRMCGARVAGVRGRLPVRLPGNERVPGDPGGPAGARGPALQDQPRDGQEGGEADRP